jgi:hypothetical protein
MTRKPPYSPQPRLIRHIISGLLGGVIVSAVWYVALVIMLVP